MSLRSKVFIAGGVSFLLVAAISIVILRGGAPTKDAPRETSVAKAPERAIEEEADAPQRPSRRAPPREAGVEVEEAGVHYATFGPDEVWKLEGRIVRPDESGALWPVEGARVTLTRHPRRTKPEEAPPPRTVRSGEDGRFELEACPGRVWMRIEIDEPSSAFRAFSFQLGDPDASGRRDLGEIPLEPAYTLKIELVGPGDQPVEKGYLLVGRESSVQGLALASFNVNDSRRAAQEVGGGKYILERTGAGPHSIKITAPGCAGTKETVDVPREEPLVIHLLEGKRIAGTVVGPEEKPLAGARVEVDSGPNLTEPDPFALTDDAGKFMFDILSDGDFEVSAQAEGYTSEKKRGVASGGDDLVFALVPEAIYSGKVVAGDGNDPVAKAKVTLASVRGDSFSADSDDQGNFVIRKITPGTFVATVNHREYATRSEPPREIAQAEKVEGIVLRLPAGFVATGAVVDSETQEPVAEAQVFFDLKSQGKNTVQGPGVRRTGKTGTDGRFEVKGLGEGNYSLSARAKGFLSGSGRQVEISAKSEREFSVPIELGGSISGRVIESAGTPVAGATVRPSVNVTSPEEWNQGFGNVFAISVATLADGSFKLEGLLPHKAYTVSATQKDHAPGASKGIVVERRGSVEGIEITLPPGATIRGRITDASGSTGIAGASVQAQLERQEESENRSFVQNNQGPSAAASDSEGNYILKALAAGSYTVRVQAKDRMSASRTGVEVEEGGTASGIDLVLGAGETLRGKVVDSDGAPVAGADVQISSNESAQTRTDAEGKFQATGVPKGSVSVNVSKQGFEQNSAQVKAPGPEVQVTLQRSAKIRGNIHAPDQETYKNYQVVAVQKRGSEENDWGNWRYSQRNDATGAFEVSVGEGTWIIQAMMQNFAPGETEPITVKAGDVVDSVVVEMKKGGEIAGTVTDRATGDPIEGAQVSFVNQAPETQRAWRVFGNPGARTDAEGAFTLEGVLDGTYTIVASHANYAQGGASGIVVTSGRSSPVKVELGAGGGIRGTVIKNGSPVPNLEIVAFLESPNDGTGVQKQAKTDAEGRFEILGLAPGEYNVMIGGWGRRGALNAQKKATVYEGQVTELEVDQGATLRLYGRVTSGGAPAGPGRIDVFNMTQGPRGGSGDIDASGSYSVELPSAGAYLIFISLPARGRNAQVRFNVTIPTGVTAYQHDIDIPSGEVFGVVFDAATGEGVPGVEVLAFAESVTFRSVSGLFQGVQGTGRTDDSGRFAISGLAPGTYTLKAFVTGYADGVAPSVRVGPQGVGMEAKIALERGISFSARVLDAGGRPVAGATVILRDEAGSFVALTRPVTSDKDGNLAFSGIRPAAYQATVVHEQYAPSRTLVEADEGVQATLRVDAGTSLSIRVTDRRGRPLEGATVELVDESGLNVMDDIAFVGLRRGQSGVSTRPDGTLTLDHLAPGRYVISARTATAASREERITLQEGKAAEVKLSLSE